jgi:orotidine-5'-phosphate decarboxylase
MASKPYRDRIAEAAERKKSTIILALDPAPAIADLRGFAEKMITSLSDHVCAIKLNFHVILPLSGSELASLTRLAHSHEIQCIADIKLNDIENTNDIVLEHLLSKMGFDAVIANPFIGTSGLQSLVKKARTMDGGIIALVYMSHPGAAEGYGLRIQDNQALYRVFLERAEKAGADGIIVGASQNPVIMEISKSSEIPIYAPGIGAQGGDAKLAASSGADYFIVGRSIVEARDPVSVARELKNSVSHL